MYDYVWRVLEHEGGFSDNPDDRGGRTYAGLTWDTYKDYCLRSGKTPSKEHHKSLMPTELLSIYKTLFIEPLRIDEYESDWVKEAVFSASINHGGYRASILVQRAVNKTSKLARLVVDGKVGAKTITAVNALTAVSFVNVLAVQRVLFVDRLVQRTAQKGDLSQVGFLVGWHNRFLRFIRPKV